MKFKKNMIPGNKGLKGLQKANIFLNNVVEEKQALIYKVSFKFIEYFTDIGETDIDFLNYADICCFKRCLIEYYLSEEYTLGDKEYFIKNIKPILKKLLSVSERNGYVLLKY